MKPPDLAQTRQALTQSPLSQGLQLIGDRWTVAVLLGAFLGLRRFEAWQSELGIPRHTLTQRLKALTALGLLRQRPYQTKPVRMGYHLTTQGLQLYPQVLMMWVWARRWGAAQMTLPPSLLHKPCGHNFSPHMCCAQCNERVGVNDLTFSLQINPEMATAEAPRQRAPRLAARADGAQGGLGLRVDRWTLLIVSAVLLGCHHFDQLSQVLGIGSSVLARRLAGMEESALLLCQADTNDARRKIYRLAPASRDLFGYIICFSSWASRHHFKQANTIRSVHKGCGHAFVPKVVCSCCGEGLVPWDVGFEGGED
ncbi:MAG: helix-turn-helix transcriptional regulator [Bdellovibrionales bacterium]|nr:helix-turn-helix transcriptional regulator [Ramlibacter sp.]